MGTFAVFASTLERVRSTPGKNEKVRILAEYMRGLDADDAERVARFATGRASLKGSADETQIGYSTISDVIEEVTGLPQRELSRVYVRHGDLGGATEELLSKKRETTLFQEDLTLGDVAGSFEEMTQAKGKGSNARKKGLLKSLLLRADGVEAKYLVKILTKEMRIGLVDGLVEEAVARAYELDRGAVREAHLLVGDIGVLARSARSGELGKVKLELLRPTNFMLAEPMERPDEIAEYFGKEVYADYKYDGVRAQLHRKGGEVRVFSRRLEEITASFPELVEGARPIDHDFMIDGEIVPFRDGRPLAFQLLQRRLRRIEGFEGAQSRAPVVFFCFDILLLDGAELYRRPLRDRREALVGLIERSPFRMAEMEPVESAGQIQRLFRSARTLGYEGLVLKDPASPYTPGRRGKYWVKLKEELDTLDVVIVGAEMGHGKRAGVISDYTFAVRDGADLRVIGKAYSGLTDAEIEDLMVKIKSRTIEDNGYYRSVKPELVIEVAFDSIQRSERHDSGFALRFPRIKRIREDKSAEQIDTIEKVKEIYSSQKVTSEQ
ncbi:MAG: ATP-dependent DNA ligase [Nitrososphaerales archaeon]|jgi:DNA ligase-1